MARPKQQDIIDNTCKNFAEALEKKLSSSSEYRELVAQAADAIAITIDEVGSIKRSWFGLGSDILEVKPYEATVKTKDARFEAGLYNAGISQKVLGELLQTAMGDAMNGLRKDNIQPVEVTFKPKPRPAMKRFLERTAATLGVDREEGMRLADDRKGIQKFMEVNGELVRVVDGTPEQGGDERTLAQAIDEALTTTPLIPDPEDQLTTSLSSEALAHIDSDATVDMPKEQVEALRNQSISPTGLNLDQSDSAIPIEDGNIEKVENEPPARQRRERRVFEPTPMTEDILDEALDSAPAEPATPAGEDVSSERVRRSRQLLPTEREATEEAAIEPSLLAAAEMDDAAQQDWGDPTEPDATPYGATQDPEGLANALAQPAGTAPDTDTQRTILLSDFDATLKALGGTQKVIPGEQPQPEAATPADAKPQPGEEITISPETAQWAISNAGEDNTPSPERLSGQETSVNGTPAPTGPSSDIPGRS